MRRLHREMRYPPVRTLRCPGGILIDLVRDAVAANFFVSRGVGAFFCFPAASVSPRGTEAS